MPILLMWGPWTSLAFSSESGRHSSGGISGSGGSSLAGLSVSQTAQERVAFIITLQVILMMG